jgi:hypothetical protein
MNKTKRIINFVRNSSVEDLQMIVEIAYAELHMRELLERLTNENEEQVRAEQTQKLGEN